MSNRGLLLILKNSFKNKFQLFGLSILVALLALVLSLMTSINARVLESYDSLKANSNAHNVVLQLDPFERVETGDVPGSTAPKNLVEAQQYWLSELQQQYYREENNLQFEWTRTEAREFSQVVTDGFNLTIKAVAKITPQNSFNKKPVDDLVIFEGQNIQSDRQVVLDPIFAQNHNIQIGNIIRIQNDILGKQLLVGSKLNENTSETIFSDIAQMEANGLDDPNGIYQKEYSGNYDWYQVVGFGGSADFMMPMINQSSSIPNRQKELLIYVDPSVFGLKLATDPAGKSKNLYEYDASVGKLTITSNSEWESFYSLKMLNSQVPNKGDILRMNTDFKKILNKEVSVDNRDYFFGANDPTYRYANRTNLMDQTISSYNIISSIVEILLAVIVFYSIGLVTRKQIEKARGQIGVLKALGYQKRQMVFNFVMTPLFTGLLGGIVGFAAGGSLSNVIVKVFSEYFILNYGAASFNWGLFFGTIILLWAVLTGVAFLIAFLVLNKNTLSLIEARKAVKISRLGMKLKSKMINKSTESKIRASLLIDARGKMSVVGIVVLASTMMFTISFAAPDILRRNQIASYEGVKYKQVVEYSDPVYNNPLTFYKTFNNEADPIEPKDPDNIFKYSKTLDGFTGLPLKIGAEMDAYNTGRIIEAYLTNNIANEYYSLFMKNAKPGDIENALPDLITTNMRFLSGQNIAASTDYYRFMAKFGDRGLEALNPLLLSQWPDYVELMSKLNDKTRSLVQNFNDFQKFYSRYVNSIGLGITNVYHTQKPDASVDAKIQSFNNNDVSNVVKQVFETTLKEQAQNFNKNLLNLKLPGSFQFMFTDSSYELGEFHITDGIKNSKTTKNDYYLTLKGDELSEGELKANLLNFILWFGALFSNRGDQGVIQAAYFRPPYFVQQFLKDAYLKKKPYSQAFGVVSYNSVLEQIGTRLQVRDANNQEFKIYGIQNNTKFLDLHNKQNNNLIAELYNDPAKNGIIINQSVAKSLKLKSGDIVNLKVLQDEFQEKTGEGAKPIELDAWDLGNLRSWNPKDESKNGFTQLNTLQNSSSVKTPSGKSYNVQAFWPTSPSSLYEAVLNGKLLNAQKETETNFKVVGIHDGYGEKQAWIKEDNAQELLKYDLVKKVAWDTWFTAQWGNEFSKDQEDVLTGFHFTGIPDLQFNKKKITYDDFIKNYVKNADPQIAKSAQKVLTIFNNAFPIFNYKYSNKDDVGDLSHLVAVHQKFGDYSPIGMNGVRADGRDIEKSVDGSGLGAISTIIPINISKAILSKLSTLVLLVLVLAIIIILLITFVIILLTTSLIIDDNVRFIATMKVLGYPNRYIAENVLGMYFIVIAVVFAIGFIGGWFIFAAIVQSLIPTIVLPLKFPIWLPFAVMMGIVGIYTITIAVGFNSIARTNATKILQNTDL